MRMPHVRPTLLLLAATIALLTSGISAQAKLDNKEWKEASVKFEELFSKRGMPKEKAELLKVFIEDGEGRSWRLLTSALVKECELWWEVHHEVDQYEAEHASLLRKGGDQGGFTDPDWEASAELEKKIASMRGVVKAENEALEAVLSVLLEGPEVLKKVILKRAASGGEWPYRAAAARIAARDPKEPESFKYLQKALIQDEDHRVRSAGLDALANAEEGWEDLVIGRLGDSSWAVQMQAVRIIEARDLKRAVPHLISALGPASPRVTEAMGKALQHLTGENFDAYPEVWAKWWEEHKEEFGSKTKVRKGGKPIDHADVEFYGLRIKSDRVLFVIDISGSMKLPTKNENPAEKWKPPPTTTGDGAPPPPPPPEEILSGPKIEVAKHELKKAIEKLTKETTFNIIAFNHISKQWKPTMMKASKKNKKDAYKWIRALKPKGSTYIHGALKLAFRLAGLVNFDKAYPDINLDTIIVLSDGAPTKSGLTPKPFPTAAAAKQYSDEILAQVAEWNKYQRVVLHCIGVDLVETVQFLKELAEQNGGTYVDR